MGQNNFISPLSEVTNRWTLFFSVAEKCECPKLVLMLYISFNSPVFQPAFPVKSIASLPDVVLSPVPGKDGVAKDLISESLIQEDILSF